MDMYSYDVRNMREIERLRASGLKLVHQGKVRETYLLPRQPDKLLQVASNRVSIFDFVLNSVISGKGMILTAMTVFWLTKVLQGFQHHLIAFGSDIDKYLPANLRNDLDLQSRALVIKKVKILPVECIVRGYLTGSGWKDYQKKGKVCGIKLPAGLKDGDELSYSLFTPSTKASVGHDVNIDARGVVKSYGSWVQNIAVGAYMIAARFAEQHGVIIADTKFEVSETGCLADEILTPDSSRFWDEDEWIKSRDTGISPKPYDKQVVREWGKAVRTGKYPRRGQEIIGIHNLDPENSHHVAAVRALRVPVDILEKTQGRYLHIFERLTGMDITKFQDKVMGIGDRRK